MDKKYSREKGLYIRAVWLDQKVERADKLREFHLYGRELSHACLIFLAAIGTCNSQTNAIASTSSGVYQPASIGEVKLLDMMGNDIRHVEIGQQAVIRTTIWSNLDATQPFVILTEIRDGNGITVYLSWHTGKLSAGGNYTAETSWMPVGGWCSDSDSGQCTIRVFAISDLVDPQVLSPVHTLQGIVVNETTQQRDRLYTLVVKGIKYDIEYSINSGNIRQIYADPDIGSLSLHLDNILSDTELTVTLPKDLMDVVFAIGDYELSSGEVIEYSPEFAVDSLFVDPISVQKTENSTTWVIPIQHGIEEVNFFVTILP